MNRLRATGFLLLIFAWAAAASPPPRDSVAQRDTTAKKPDSTVKKTPHIASSSYRWPIDTSVTVCREPLETAADCWRRSSRWANQEIGFPGARSRTLSLSTLEPASIETFFQPSLSESPYGTGGYIPFDRVEEGADISEIWTPVLPIDTPVISLHWTRGALGLNQFTVNLRRMVGDRAYFGLQIHSDEVDSEYYQYSFQVHQPYLAGWGIPALKRDSASLVIQDTMNAIRATEIRPRLGFWLDSQTVIEVFGDWMKNSSSLANPTNPAANDSTQLLYPASFSDLTVGAVAARSTLDYRLRAALWHADWDRTLQPRLQDSVAPFSENASGSLDRFRVDGSLLRVPGRPQFWAMAEYAVTDNIFRLHGVTDSMPIASAEGERAAIGVQMHPHWNFMDLNLNAETEDRNRPDGVQEWLGGASGDLNVFLPGNFTVTGATGWNREGAGDDTLFRWQPASGLYPNPGLKPRTDLHLQGGASWESKMFGLGASWESHRYGENWLPGVLPEPDLNLPDSLALALVNYQEETRELLHLSMFLNLGNWHLWLLNTWLIDDAIRDNSRLGYTESNRQVPDRVFKGQLLWKRRLIDGRLGLQTGWDWEWFSTRYVYASDLDGYSRVLKLDEYLDLDFTAQMEIKTFALYFRAMNLNHDRYATEPGVHPPGVNFRFGVDWRLFN